MNRRELFGVPLLLFPAAFLSIDFAGAAEPKPFRRWYRFDRGGAWRWDALREFWIKVKSDPLSLEPPAVPVNPWIPIRFEDIKAGMEIWVEDSETGSEVVMAGTDCEPLPRPGGGFYYDGEPVFFYAAKIDPKTNQWVYH